MTIVSIVLRAAMTAVASVCAGTLVWLLIDQLNAALRAAFPAW